MDPYKVLGIGYDATDDEIKSAYRKLSRKYHPDANVGNPNQKAYEEKFKEVQQAYSMIMDQKQGKANASQGWNGNYGQSANAYGSQNYDGQEFQDFWNSFFGFGNQGGQYRQSAYQGTQEDQYINSALNYIRSGYYREGINVLEQIPKERRTAEWFYYSAFANYKAGNNVTAVEHAKAACALEPDNEEYRRLLYGITGSENRYQSKSTRYGGNPSMQGSNYCGETMAAMLCFSTCCGGGMPILCCI